LPSWSINARIVNSWKPGNCEDLLSYNTIWLHAISKRTVSAGRRAFCSSRPRMERFLAGNSKETRGQWQPTFGKPRSVSQGEVSLGPAQHMETVGDASRALQKYTVLSSSSVHIGVGRRMMPNQIFITRRVPPTVKIWPLHQDNKTLQPAASLRWSCAAGCNGSEPLPLFRWIRDGSSQR
jgi:hypothetical protein